MSDTMNAGALFAALAAAQGQMGAAHKDKTNPHFRSKYADLASCWDACREPLAANGLCVIQATEPAEGRVCVVTTLGHKSGLSISSRTSVPMDKQNAHGYGSALTYARRYGLMAIVGIAPAEDDGTAAAKKQEEKPWRQTKEGRAIAKLFAKCPHVNARDVRLDLDEGTDRHKVLSWLRGESKKSQATPPAEGGPPSPAGGAGPCPHPPLAQVRDAKTSVLNCGNCGEVLEGAMAGATDDPGPEAF